MKIKKAVIAVAGVGTRFLPITKTIQKEMLPVINKPVIDYLVEDLIKAGIEEIVFVVNSHNKQILHYYSENKRLANYLSKVNKLHLYDQVKNLHSKAKFHFITQTESDQYGTAVPVILAKDYLKNEEAFIVLMGDDIPFNANGSSETKNMIKKWESSGADALATFIKQDEDQLYRYGIAKTVSRNGEIYLKDLIEKPKPGTAPSNLANISKYILTQDVFTILEKQRPNQASGELYITDTVAQLAKIKDVVIHIPQGDYLDCGYTLGWLKANLVVSKNDPKLRRELKSFIGKIDF